jgi:hypothetical protein
MKTTLIPSKPRKGSLNRVPRQGRLRHAERYAPGFSPRTDRSLIQWPSERELKQVSATLTKVSRTGMRQENAGDYFTSGDLAYQLQEILRATATLLKKSRRFNS